MAPKQHIYHLPLQHQNGHPAVDGTEKKKRGSDKLKYIKGLVALLLVNEIVIGLVVNFSSEQPTATPLNSNEAVETKPLAANAAAMLARSSAKQQEQQTFSPPLQKSENRISFSDPDVNASLADGMDDLRHACLSFDDDRQTHHISYRGAYGSWDGRTKDRHDKESIHLASRKNHWLQTTYIPKGENVTLTEFDAPVMFVPSILDPSHCIQDLLFSLLPVAFYGRLQQFEAVAVKRPDSSGDGPARSFAGDYCTLVLEELKWFKKITLVPNETCVDNLWVPAMMYHRFPRGHETTKTLQSTSGYFHNKDMPIRMLQFFHVQMGKRFLANNPHLVNLQKENKNRIVFDTREGLHSGEWTNAKEIAELVREKLDPNIFTVEVVDDVDARTVAEQAALFRSATILVAPHGVSLANAIFMRPGSIVFELSCGEQSWVRDWVSDLGIRHSIVRADDPPCKVEGRRTYAVQPTTLVELIVDIYWRGQRKRTTKEVKVAALSLGD